MSYLRVRLSIALAKSVHLCLRNSRRKPVRPLRFLPPDPTDPDPTYRLVVHP
jgi:hypothetical protein